MAGQRIVSAVNVAADIATGIETDLVVDIAIGTEADPVGVI